MDAKLDEDRAADVDAMAAMRRLGGVRSAWLRMSVVLDSTMASARRQTMAVEYLRVIFVIR